jgi:putative flippase GtrA
MRVGTHDELLVQFLCFAAFGAVGTCAHYVVLLACVLLLGLGAAVASALGYLIGGCINYLLNYRFTFKSTMRHGQSATRFVIVATAGFVINWALMEVLTARQFNFLVAQVCSTAVVLAFNFGASRIWAFRVIRP